jgi:TRAP-type C4-dicarboxylate transport system substrate-binding protein
MDMRTERLRGVIASALALAVVSLACATPPGRGVGNQPASVVLTLGNGNHGHEELQPFADAVAAATSGTVTIEFKDQAHQGDPAFESAIIDDVRAGTFDLAWTAPRPWHGKGISTFDPLTAPFLVDSYGLQRAILASDLVPKMLAGVDSAGLVGLGILPGPMRHIATADVPFRGAGDLRGKVVGIQESVIAAKTMEALGASATSIPSGGGLGNAEAVEQQLAAMVGNRYHHELGHVTVDLPLWPRPLILFANKARFDSLSADQQTALRAASGGLLPSTLAALEAEDSSAIVQLCADGADIVVAGDGAAPDLLAAVQPVYDELAKDVTTAAIITEIRGMKAGISAPTSPPTCTANPPSAAAATGGGFPEGTYEARVSCADLETFWATHPVPTSERFECPIVMGFTLKDGNWVENYGERWKYSFFGDHVQLGDFSMRWTWDGTQLTFSEIEGGAAGDAQAWTTKPFTRIADAGAPAVGFPDGTYRADVSAEEMTAFWDEHAVPEAQRKDQCPCRRDVILRDGVWTGSDGSVWQASFFGDKLTLTDPDGSITLRWRYDPQLEEISFVDVETGNAPEDIDLEGFFMVKPFDRVRP